MTCIGGRVPINRTIFGIETFVSGGSVIFAVAINRTIFGIETGQCGQDAGSYPLSIAPSLELKQKL